MKTLTEYSELLTEYKEARLLLVEMLATNQITVDRYRMEMMALANSEARRIAQQLGKTN